MPAAGSAVRGELRLFSQAEPVQYQSALERDFIIMCDYAPEVRHVRWEPFTFKFYDHVSGRKRRYTPDFLVETITREGARRTYVVETKRKVEYDAIFSRDPEGTVARALMAASSWCRAQPSSEMVVATDEWLRSRGFVNVKLIMGAATYGTPSELIELLTQHIVNHAGLPLGRLVELGDEGGASRPVVISTLMRMCFEDRCHFDITRPLGDEVMFHEGRRDRVFRF